MKGIRGSVIYSTLNISDISKFRIIENQWLKGKQRRFLWSSKTLYGQIQVNGQSNEAEEVNERFLLCHINEPIFIDIYIYIYICVCVCVCVCI